MAAPFALEDLKKLQTFIEFVASKPSILNLPQLDFLKKLIEKFGGKVPEGDFEMPAGGKCPFGGDVKSESKSAPTPAAEAEPEEEEKAPEVDEESEESEVELDMEANDIPLYLEEKPPSTVTFKKAAKQKHPTKSVMKKTIAKSKQTKVSPQKSNLVAEITVKMETGLESDKPDILYPNDPLYTPELLIKSEIEENKIEPEEDRLLVEDIEHNHYEMREDEEFYFDSDTEQYEMENENKQFYVNEDEEEEEEEDDDEDEDYDDGEDEPLILLTNTKGGSRKKYKVPRFQSCLDTCKLKCNAKFAHDQRRDIYDYYHNLSDEVKLQFIRKHIKKRLQKRVQYNTRGNNCCYFLKYYKLNDMASWTNSNDDDNLTKVCRKFFQGTLGLGNYDIREATDGFEIEQEKLVRPMAKKEEHKTQEGGMVKPQKPQLFLDPETGNLTDSKPKTKAKRRKPGEPERERFPRPINCAIRCTFKCHQHFNEEERKQICDIFWSLDYKRRKDFILARIETKDVKTATTPEFRKTNRPTRAFQTRFYLRSGIHSENKRVCKHFMMNTLCINRMVIENAIKHADKTTGNYTGVDGRGKHLIHKINPERKQSVFDHINSYPTWRPNKKSKLRCLHNTLSIKKMYKEYKEKCKAEQLKPVSAFYYCKIFHDEFRLQFLNHKDPKRARGFLNINPNLSHYNGEEPGGSWIDFSGNPLDVRHINPGESLNYTSTASHLHQRPSIVSCSSTDSSNTVVASTSMHLNQTAAQHVANFVTPTAAAATTSIIPTVILQTSVQNLNNDNNLPNSSASSMFRMI